MSKSQIHIPWVDEIFGIGTFYRRIGIPDAHIRSIHAVGDGVVAAGITVEHNDFYTNVFTSVDTLSTAGGLPPKGSLTTIGIGDLRFWQPDPAIGSLVIAASATVTGGARVPYSNQPAAFSRVVIITSVGGRLVITGAGLEG